MFDINDKLDYLLKEYGIYKRDLLRNRLETAIRHIISEYTEKYGRRIIVRGLKYSEKGYPLLKIISEYGDIIAVVDKQPFAENEKLLLIKEGAVLKGGAREEKDGIFRFYSE